MKVTLVPEQIELPETVAIETEGVTEAFTVIVTELLVAVDEEAQAAVEVITQVTTSLFANEDEE